jgi:hypothetical protein
MQSNTIPIITKEEFEPAFLSQPKVTMVDTTLLTSHLFSTQNIVNKAYSKKATSKFKGPLMERSVVCHFSSFSLQSPMHSSNKHIPVTLTTTITTTQSNPRKKLNNLISFPWLLLMTLPGGESPIVPFFAYSGTQESF